MATSSVPRVKVALLGIMQTALPTVTLPSTAVTWGPPAQYVTRECVYMSDATFDSEVVAALRTSPRQQDETYTIPVHCEVVADGNDLQSAEERVWELAGAIETAIRNDQSLGALTWTGGTLHWAVVAGKEPLNYMSDQGWCAHVMVKVSCHARI